MKLSVKGGQAQPVAANGAGSRGNCIRIAECLRSANLCLFDVIETERLDSRLRGNDKVAIRGLSGFGAISSLIRENLKKGRVRK